MKEEEEIAPEPENPSLVEMTWLFLQLGSIGFGGGIAMIALMEEEFVKRRHYIDKEEFLHGVALSQILGSFPVNTALFVGYHLHGFLGGLLGSTVFLFPSFAAVILLSWLYFTYSKIPSLQSVLDGLAPVVIGVILTAAWSMGQKAIGSYVAVGIVLGGCIGTLIKISPVIILGVGGIIGLLLKMTPRKPQQKQPQAVIALPLAMEVLPHKVAQLTEPASQPAAVNLATLGWTFLKVGFVFFGGGVVLIPVLKQLLIDNLHWLTPKEFIDGVAISQLTPGPIAVIATFAGFRMGGLAGAIVATVGLFLPSIVLMFFLAMYYQKIKHLQPVKHFLSGVNPAVVGMVVSAAINLAPSVFPLDQPVKITVNAILLAISLLVIGKLKWHPAIGLAIGAAVGVVLTYSQP
ncbi:MAG: chromate efflux transporter [Pseudanabaenaceae cyanobacterium SKYGB_i_bin29]|nr:chromate efflux transporter [Pseudanabaenaceae cyanobacterium SKYG29]MDW8421051.1 chromate efflux transporter [Pseudanabaenaceae cyanobacterium SKYGB_i_bin29]